MNSEIKLTKPLLLALKKKGWRISKNPFTKRQYFHKYEAVGHLSRIIGREGDTSWHHDLREVQDEIQKSKG